MLYGHLIAATVMTLGVCQGHSSIARIFYTNKCVARSVCHSSASFCIHSFIHSLGAAVGRWQFRRAFQPTASAEA